MALETPPPSSAPPSRTPLAPPAPPSPLTLLPPNDSRAVLSLVLGAFSLVTCGFTGIPAVVIGFTARSSIERSGGAVRGSGIAAAGIATGVIGSAMALVSMAAFLAGLLFNAQGTAARRPLFTPSPESTTAWAPAVPAHPERAMVVGAIHLTDIDPDSKAGFHQQLAEEAHRAAGAHETVVVMTSAKWCGVCKEFQASLTDPRMQAALANVDIVRVDVDDFDQELHAAGMLEGTLPWFYKIDGSLRPVDAISAGEWDDNVAANMAPVLQSFLAGTLRTRRDATGISGGTLL